MSYFVARFFTNVFRWYRPLRDCVKKGKNKNTPYSNKKEKNINMEDA